MDPRRRSLRPMWPRPTSTPFYTLLERARRRQPQPWSEVLWGTWDLGDKRLFWGWRGATVSRKPNTETNQVFEVGIWLSWYIYICISQCYTVCTLYRLSHWCHIKLLRYELFYLMIFCYMRRCIHNDIRACSLHQFMLNHKKNGWFRGSQTHTIHYNFLSPNK